MKTGINRTRITRTAGALLIFFVLFMSGAVTPFAVDLSNTANPELIGQLTKTLNITPAQASGGAGALFGLAKGRLSAADFSKVAANVPGMESLIKSAPASKSSAVKGLSGLESGEGARKPGSAKSYPTRNSPPPTPHWRVLWLNFASNGVNTGSLTRNSHCAGGSRIHWSEKVRSVDAGTDDAGPKKRNDIDFCDIYP